MEDNDIRGFLDGRFVHPWNQPGQIHVRVGRIRRGPSVGEFEILRVLQRWEGIQLPGDARVHDAGLVLEVEEAEGISPGEVPEVEVYLYEVLKDWAPGTGGREGDNNSPPAPGEVWWNEPRCGEGPWGLPGCGLHSDTDPHADTPSMPLAVARFRPDQRHLSFRSPRLAAYVQRQARSGAPLRFLLKLADVAEDRPGTLLSLYSANHGASEDTERRPRLDVTWSSPTGILQRDIPVLLEHGRRTRLPPIQVDTPGLLALSFIPAEGEDPRLLIRAQKGPAEVPPSRGPVSPPTHPSPAPEEESAFLPRRVEPGRVEVELQALRRPVPLGRPFTAAFRDTWVRSGPPETQSVPWYLLSPSGVMHRVLARYVGGFWWEVDFLPDEPGRWHFRWSHRFSRAPFRSPVGAFDVVVGEGGGLDALGRLLESADATPPGPGRKRMLAWGRDFGVIQRALVVQGGVSGRERDSLRFDVREDAPADGVGAALDEAREQLGGMPRPGHPRLEPQERFPLE